MTKRYNIQSNLKTDNPLGMNFVAFEPGLGANHRIRMQGNIPLSEGLFFDHAASAKSLIENDLAFNALYYSTFNKMLKKRHYNVTAEELAKPDIGPVSFKPVLFATQPLLEITANFETIPTLDNVYPKESSTRYRFQFGASRQERDMVALVPTIKLDTRAFKILTEHLVSPELVNAYLHHFMQIAELSQHDGTVHQLMQFRQGEKDFLPEDYRLHPVPPDATLLEGGRIQEIEKERIRPIRHLLKGKELPKNFGVNYLEMHALTLQAQILKQMFDDPKTGRKRKDHVLRSAAETFGQLADMQQVAWKNCKQPEDRQAVSEAITYLAEIYYQRFARVIAPQDKALKRPILGINAEPSDSVQNAANRIELFQRRGQKLSLKSDTLDQLDEHASSIYGTKIFHTIHEPNLFPVATYAPTAPGAEPAALKDSVVAIDMLDALDALMAIRSGKKALSRNIMHSADARGI